MKYLLAILLAGILTLSPVKAEAGVISSTTMQNQIAIARYTHGKPFLVPNKTLKAQSKTRVIKMAKSGKLQHLPGLKMGKFRCIGENVGVGPSSKKIQKAFMKSPGHRRNILDRHYHKIGLTTYKYHGRVWVVQLFAC